MLIYNTLTGKKEDFKPLSPPKVGIYVCGVTVYDLCHIGHARSLIVFDIIYRYLKFKGYDVTFVRNFTDIDDKIIKRANEENITYKEISERYIDEFNKDVKTLNILPPTFEPKATEHISEMINFIQTLVNKGFAYNVDGNVYFAVDKFKDYGKLSKKNTDDLLSGARIDIDQSKRNPLDFALWKKSKDNEPFWDSPWGKGRPGWHIECSVMSMKYLGSTFDIHGGGKDLIFPHHENEIAQSEAFSSLPFATHWIHNGFVNINKEKMSKSLGNFFTIRDTLQKVPPDVLRFFLLNSHYHKPIDFSEESIETSKNAYLKLCYAIDRLLNIVKDFSSNSEIDENSLSKTQKKFINTFQSFKVNFFNAMDDDFNSAKAIGFLFEFISELNKIINIPNLNPNEDFLKLLFQIKLFFEDFSKITGLFSTPPSEFIEIEKEKFLKESNISADFIVSKINERNIFRSQKNWESADMIRKELETKGIFLEDGKSSTIWKIII